LTVQGRHETKEDILVIVELRADVLVLYLVTDEIVKEQKKRGGTGWLYRPIQTIFNQNKDYIQGVSRL